MSFLRLIEERKAKLKKTETINKESKNVEDLIVKDEEDYYRLMKETYFEQYYSLIEEFTFKSVILPLSLQDIQDITKAYAEFDAEGTDNYDLKSIENKVDEGIEKIREKTNTECQVFVRLSSRSPKDAIYHLEHFPKLYQEKLLEFKDQEDVFSKLHAFYRASTEVLSVSTGKEATDLLRRSNRIQGDLEACLENNETMQLIVREFVQFPVENELRGFIYNGVLTALTQYNNIAYFPQHKKDKEHVEQKVKIFTEKLIVAMKPSLDSFVVDIVIDVEGRVWAVEVNPFGELAGSCLFSWSKDRSILTGHSPFEFRTVDSPPSLGSIKCESDPRVMDLLGIH